MSTSTNQPSANPPNFGVFRGPVLYIGFETEQEAEDWIRRYVTPDQTSKYHIEKLHEGVRTLLQRNQ